MRPYFPEISIQHYPNLIFNSRRIIPTLAKISTTVAWFYFDSLLEFNLIIVFPSKVCFHVTCSFDKTHGWKQTLSLLRPFYYGTWTRVWMAAFFMSKQWCTGQELLSTALNFTLELSLLDNNYIRIYKKLQWNFLIMYIVKAQSPKEQGKATMDLNTDSALDANVRFVNNFHVYKLYWFNFQIAKWLSLSYIKQLSLSGRLITLTFSWLNDSQFQTAKQFSLSDS